MPEDLERLQRPRMTDFRQHQRSTSAQEPGPVGHDKAAAAVVVEAVGRLRANGHLYFELAPLGSARIAVAVRHHRPEDAALVEYGERFYADDPLTAAFRDRLHRGEAFAQGPAIVALGEVPQRLRSAYESRFLRGAGIADVLGLGVPVLIGDRPRMLCFGFHRGAADPGFTTGDKGVLTQLADGLRLRAENLALHEELARRLPPRPTVTTPLDVATVARLTEREREVAELMMTGHGNRQLAHELGLTINTVENHLRSIYAKLGVRSRGRATARLLEGMLPHRHGGNR